MKIRRQVYDSENVGKITQSLIDAGFSKVKFEHCDGSTIGQNDFLYIEAETNQWKEIDDGTKVKGSVNK